MSRAYGRTIEPKTPISRYDDEGERCSASLRELAAKKRGAKPAERNPLDAKLRALEAQVARLEHELHTAHTILDVQGKVAGLLGLNLEHGTRS